MLVQPQDVPWICFTVSHFRHDKADTMMQLPSNCTNARGQLAATPKRPAHRVVLAGASRFSLQTRCPAYHHLPPTVSTIKQQPSDDDSSSLNLRACDCDRATPHTLSHVAPLVPVAALALGLLAAPAEADAMSLSDLTDAAVDAVAASGWLGPAVFVALYVAATVLLFPASVLTLAAGALFGPLAGTALVSLASTTGATAAFLVSRYLARPWVERQISGLPRFKAVLSGVAAKGAYVVFLLRLSPLVPFNLLNYACGLTPVPLLPYVLSSWVGMLPGTFAYVYLGGAGKAAVSAAAGGGGMDTTQVVLYGVGAVATILATRVIGSAAGKALEEEQASS